MTMSTPQPPNISVEFSKARFLSDPSAVAELLLLLIIDEGGPVTIDRLQKLSLFNRQQIATIRQKLLQDGDIVIEEQAQQEICRITRRGAARCRYMFVDYFHELRQMQHRLIENVVARLSKLAQEGVRSVAVYPVGETAEVVAGALATAGMSLAMAVDDSPSMWGRTFHGVAIRPPIDLVAAPIDAVILSTCVFQEQLRKQLASLGVDARIITF